jgi:hypothetical protein
MRIFQQWITIPPLVDGRASFRAEHEHTPGLSLRKTRSRTAAAAGTVSSSGSERLGARHPPAYRAPSYARIVRYS